MTGDSAELARIGAPGFDPRRAVLTSSPIPGLSDSETGSSSPGTAGITDYQAEKVTIDAHATRPSELVLSDTYYPGWSVSVNGKPAKIDEVDYLLRGVRVPAGNDRIVFTYDPSSFRTGWIVSLVTSVSLIAAVVVVLWRRRRQPQGRREAVETHSGTASGAFS